jgi:hypothetical protein
MALSFNKVIKQRLKALKRKRKLKARVYQFKKHIKALSPISKSKQEHINKLKALK